MDDRDNPDQETVQGRSDTEPVLQMPEPASAPLASSSTWPLRFTGSGSEYFRIWIVNLLLTLVTLTLYWPFARARKLRYFYSNTWVGEDALGFHADPWRMFRGYLLMLVLGVAYWTVSHFSPALSWVPLLVLALIWPALWRSSLIFRMRNTSYRGLRFDFQGGLKDVYLVILPLFAPSLGFVLLATLSMVSHGQQAPTAAEAKLYFWGVLTLLALTLAVFPWLLARMYRYQFNAFALAQQRSGLAVASVTESVYGIGVTCVGFYLLGGVAVGLLNFAAGMALPLMAMPVVFMLTFYALAIAVSAYWQSRMQNLLWGQLVSQDLRLHSRLDSADLFRVTALNWLFIVLTLGLFWPFAAVRTARVRLEAISVEVQGDVNSWVGQLQAQQAGVLGDAAGDFFGVDVGL